MDYILLIEDDPSIAQLYKTKLEINQFKVLIAQNGLDGLNKAKENTPDLVLLDLMMPVMTGDIFLEKFRKIENFSKVPVIVLTNVNRSEAPQTIWHHGIAGYFVKAHSTPTELLNQIKKVLETEIS